MMSGKLFVLYHINFERQIMERLVRFKERLKKGLPGYILNLSVLLVFWGGLLRKSYNYDTVYHMVVDDADVMTRIRGGRYAAALIDYALLKFGLRTTDNISITILLSLLILAAAMYAVRSLFEKYAPDDKLAKAGFYCGLGFVFLNVQFAELLMFSEYSIYYALAYFAAALGVLFYFRKKYPAAILMYAIAVSFYQNSVVFAAILSAFYILADEKMHLSIKAVLREITAVMLCMAMGGLDLISIRILEKLDIIPLSGKVSGLGDISQKLSDAFGSFVLLNKSGGGMLPGLWLPFIFEMMILAAVIYYCIKEHKADGAVFLLMVCMGSFALLYVIPFASFEFFFPPRLSFCFFLAQGLLLVSAYLCDFAKTHRLLGLAGVFYLFVHFIFADFIVTDHLVSNALDEVYVNMVYEEILKYEKESGIQVTKLAVMKDAYAPSCYSQLSDISAPVNARTIDEVPVSIIQVVTGRDLEKTDMPAAIRDKYFKDKDWDHFDADEQLVIEGDTAYWCVF